MKKHELLWYQKSKRTVWRARLVHATNNKLWMDKAIGWRVNFSLEGTYGSMHSGDCLLESEWCFSPLVALGALKMRKDRLRAPELLLSKSVLDGKSLGRTSRPPNIGRPFIGRTPRRLQIIRSVIIRLLRMSKTTHWLVSVKSVTKQNEKKKRCVRSFYDFSLFSLIMCSRWSNHANCHASDDINKWIWSTS